MQRAAGAVVQLRAFGVSAELLKRGGNSLLLGDRRLAISRPANLERKRDEVASDERISSAVLVLSGHSGRGLLGEEGRSSARRGASGVEGAGVAGVVRQASQGEVEARGVGHVRRVWLRCHLG